MMNNIDKAVEEKINECAKPNNEAQNTSKPEGSLSEAQEQYWKEFTEKMKKELHVADPEDVEQEMEKSLLVKEASKFYAEPHELQEMEQKQANNLLITMAQQIEDADNVNHPQHYTGSIECIDAMLQQFGKEQVKSFCLLNAFKYLFRCNKKHETPIEDIKKAMWYLNKYIEIVNNI